MAKRNGAVPQCVKDAPTDAAAALEEGDGPRATYGGNAALLAALAAVRKNRTPAEAMLLEAKVAGEIIALATALHDMPAPKPPEYTGGIPRGRDLRMVCRATFSKALGRLTAKGATS